MACNKTEPVCRTHRLAFHGTGTMHNTALYTGEVAANRSLPELLPAVMKISTHTQLAEKQTSMRDFFLLEALNVRHDVMYVSLSPKRGANMFYVHPHQREGGSVPFRGAMPVPGFFSFSAATRA
jgi:hypothetical protein